MAPSVDPNVTPSPNRTILSRRLRALGLFAVASILTSCARATSHDDITASGPTSSGTPRTTFLQSTAGVPLRGLPRFQLSALPGAAEVTWEVEGGACVSAEATSAQSGSVLAISIRRAGGPATSCYPGPVGYRYVARALGLAAGQYEVRLIDVAAGGSPRLVGSGTLTIAPASTQHAVVDARASTVEVARSPSAARE